MAESNYYRVGERPTKIYKYASIEVGASIIFYSTLKFSSPQVFNDPFDCDIDLIEFSYTDTLDEKVSAEISELKQKYPGTMEKGNEFWSRGYKHAVIEKINKSGICCFSLRNNNVQMWSHYGNMHKGVCVEFDNNLENRFVNIKRSRLTEGVVNYQFNENINYLSNRLDGIQKLFLSKASDWAYEAEYRIIVLNYENEHQHFHPEFVKAIYFGLRVSESEIVHFVLACRQNNAYRHLKFYHAKKNKLSLEFEEITFD